MNDIDNLHIILDLADGQECQLKHADGDEENREAVNAIVLPTSQGTLSIPVCEECNEVLLGDEWVLFYCLNCNESAWGLRELCRRPYKDTIVWLNFCHNCCDEEG